MDVETPVPSNQLQVSRDGQMAVLALLLETMIAEGQLKPTRYKLTGPALFP